jgi:hypothetical protein
MATDPKAAFRTHSNYLSAFDAVMAQCYSPDRYTLLTPLGDVLQGLASAVRASPAFGRLTKRSDADTGAVSAILRNAWATELLLASAGQLARDELIGLANNWAVVQAYYASYHAAQALTVARGQPRPQTHTKTQKAYCDFWVARPVSLPPWSLAWAASGCANLPRRCILGRGATTTRAGTWWPWLYGRPDKMRSGSVSGGSASAGRMRTASDGRVTRESGSRWDGVHGRNRDSLCPCCPELTSPRLITV